MHSQWLKRCAVVLAIVAVAGTGAAAVDEADAAEPEADVTWGTTAREGVVRTFDEGPVGAAPGGFTEALTGKGRPGEWRVQEDPSAPSGGRVVAQTDADRTNYRFPVLVDEGIVAADVELSARFKPISGRVDQAAGLVWRYQDANNYYVVRANALENNVVAYKVEDGRRSDLPVVGRGRSYGVEAPVPANRWSTLGLSARGSRFTVSLDGSPVFQVEDTTFTQPGRVGLWTKADSVTAFDDLRIVVLDGGS